MKSSCFYSLYILYSLIGPIATLSGSAWSAIPTGVTCTTIHETNSTNRLTLPVWVGEVPGKAGVLLVVEQGRETPTADLWILQKEGATSTKKKFLSLAVRKNMNEMGLLGFAFHPKFAINRKYYLHYNPDGALRAEASVVDERTADNTFLKDSGNPPRRIITVDQANSTGHKGGALAFGSDGYLYWGLGDGENFREPQRKTSLFGKVLRLDVDNPAPDMGYSIPSDNPFANEADATIKKEIFALGLRNPFRFSFDAANGDLWVGDVGNSSREEIDVVRKDGNYGWSDVEGDICGFTTNCDTKLTTAPITVLGRSQSACIIGGHVFHGTAGSGFNGVYIFADYGGHTLWGLTHKDYVKEELIKIGECPQTISSIGTDASGNLYAVGHEYGAIYKLTHGELLTVAIDRNNLRSARQARLRQGAVLWSQLRTLRSGLAPLQLFRYDGRKVFALNRGEDLDQATMAKVVAGVYVFRIGGGAEDAMGLLLVPTSL